MEIICKKCGLINDYKTIYKPSNNSYQAWCNGCGNFIKNISHSKNDTLHFGQYKGKMLHEVNDKKYLEWFAENVKNIKIGLKENIYKRILEL